MMAGRTRRRTLLAITAAAALVTAADGRVGARAQDATATAPAAQGAFDAAMRSYERALQGLESDAEQGDVQAQGPEESRVGEERVRKCRGGWVRVHIQKNI